MKTTKLLTVLMILALIFSLSACGAADKNNDDDMGAEIAQLLAAEPENLEEAAELYKKKNFGRKYSNWQTRAPL